MMIIVDDLLVLDARLSGCVRVREFTHTLRSAASRVSVSKLIKISTERERLCPVWQVTPAQTLTGQVQPSVAECKLTVAKFN